MIVNFSKKWKKEAVSNEVWFNRNFSQLPEFKLHPLDSNVFASYSGPDCGLAFLHDLENPQDKLGGRNNGQIPVDAKLISGCQKWNIKNRKAYGISMSLYDQHPLNGKITGDPVADCFGLCARGNSSVMIVADGVNWGDKSRLAARCAVYGAMKHINDRLFRSLSKGFRGEAERMTRSDSHVTVAVPGGGDGDGDRDDVCGGVTMSSSFAEELGAVNEERDKIETTKDVFSLLLTSLEEAHRTILRHKGGLTTLCVCLVCPIIDSPEGSPGQPSSPTMDGPQTYPFKTYAACVVNVGDSLAFVFSRRNGVREITTGSHDVTLERNIRDAGGALGPVCESGEPELNNLTCSITCVEAGDVVFLATDGITDNFDPVVTKIAVAKKMDPNSSPFKRSISISNKGPEKMTSSSVNEPSTDSSNKRSVTEMQSSVGISFEGTGLPPDPKEGSFGKDEDVERMTVGSFESSIHCTPSDSSSKATPMVSSTKEEEVVELESRRGDVDGGESKEVSAENAVKEEGSGKVRLEVESGEAEDDLGLENGRPVMLPFERHRYAIKEMERVIHEFELFTECPCSAQELCGAILQHVLKLTDPKRKVLENPDLYGKKKRLKAEERQNRDSEIVSKLAQSPGKLDHATVIGYEVGCYHGNEDEDYCME